MNLDQIETKCFILALFIRDDGERFLLGSRAYEFIDSQLHFAANSYQNDIVEVQGNDGIMLAGQVRRATSQAFDGYIGDSSVNRTTIEQYRQDFLKFFRKNHYYKVVYVFPNGSAIQRRNGFIVEAPEVKELYQLFPQYHISMNFEDINYYEYKEDEDGQEIYGESANLNVSTAATGGLIWEESTQSTTTEEGTNFTILGTEFGGSIDNVKLSGDTTQSGTPTPTSPQPVNTVTGRQVVTVSDGGSQSQEYEVNLGKNLFNAANGPNINNLVRDVAFDENTYTLSVPSSSSTSSGNRFTGFYITSLQEGITYTISYLEYTGSIATDSRKIMVRSYDGSSTTELGMLTSNKTQSFTVPVGSQRIELFFYTTQGTTSTFSKIQLERGSTATTYAAYFTPIELCKIGTYQDYIYKSGGDWYLHKATGSVVLNGSELYSANTRTNGTQFDTPNTNQKSGDSSQKEYFCDNFSCITFNDRDSQSESIYSHTGDSSIRILTNVASTTNAFKTWLSSHNTTVYYILATATDTQITNAALVAQLQALAGATTYASQTIFTVTSPNQLGILSLSATVIDGGGVVWDSIGATWEEGTGGGPTMISIDSIDNVYPIWEVTGPAVNPQISVLTTNTTLSYTGTITSSQTLKVDMFNKTAILNGTSVIGNVSGDWVNLAPGINRVTYTTNNADAPDSTLWWQEIVG